MKQTADKTQKKPDSSMINILRRHAAIRPVVDHDVPRTISDKADTRGWNFSQMPLNSAESASLSTNVTQSCPFTPQRCPFGGACHTCPPRVRATQSFGIQRKATNNDELSEIQPIVHEVLQSPGQPLDPQTRAFFEPRFGQDFSRVIVHSDGRAAKSARALNSIAFTIGREMVFGDGQYAPATSAGRRLLAHELAHTVQQAGYTAALQAQLVVGAINTPAESEAEHAAELVTSEAPALVTLSASAPIIRRHPGRQGEEEAEPDFNSPQRRGGRARSAFIDAGRRGEDQVRIAVTRYLCDCAGRNVTRTHASAHLQPRPGITLEFCRGRVTGRVVGDVEPSSLTTGRASVRGEINVAPGQGGTGARIGVEGEVRNTGSEPQVGGRADVRVRTPGGPQVGAGGEIFRGTRSGQIDTEINAGVDVGGVRLRIGATNVQDPSRRGGTITIGGDLPGQNVEDQTCRECRCPIVYECLEDTPPRDYEEPVTYDIEDRSRLRYYFSLDTNQDTRDSTLRGESTRMLSEVAQRVSGGARIRSVTGYASPEDNRDRPTPNEQLSMSRAQRLHDLITARLGTSVQLPEPQAGGELFGRVATITPGSRLADAMLDVGFGDPEDVTTFLIGTDIPNPQLADQFLNLLKRVTEPADRLRLFGIDSTSPAAPNLLAAINQFVRNGGRGRRPWENVFGYLRFATVELSTTRHETRMEQRRTSGSIRPLNDTVCSRYARQAEGASRFGPMEAEPQNEAGCPGGEPRNLPQYTGKCDYD